MNKNPYSVLVLDLRFGLNQALDFVFVFDLDLDLDVNFGSLTS